MKALVTGATGFLGSHIVDELMENNYEVRVLIRKTSNTRFIDKYSGIEKAIGDITQAETLPEAMKDVDVVFNNAAIMEDWGPWKKFERVNLQGTLNVLEAARKLEIKKIVHTSSTAVYGFPNKKTPITEEFPKKPFGNYQKSKYEAQKAADQYVSNYDMDISSIRPPFIFGARDSYTIPIAIESIVSGDMMLIGSGNQIQSIVHARDAAHCIRLAAEKPDTKGESFNVTSFDIDVKTLYTRIAELIGASPEFTQVSYKIAHLFGTISEGFGLLLRKKTSPTATRFRVKLLGQNYRIDCTKAKEILGYKPNYDFETTISDSLRWYYNEHPEKQRPSALA
ncbi:MAG: NAD-dependent epimerase/dehydratase family protein [Promethearchaeota archaeon]